MSQKAKKYSKKNQKYTVRITSNMTYVVDDSRPRVPKWVQHRIMDNYTLQKRTGFADYNLITQHKRIRLRISLKHKIGFIFREKKVRK